MIYILLEDTRFTYYWRVHDLHTTGGYMIYILLEGTCGCHVKNQHRVALQYSASFFLSLSGKHFACFWLSLSDTKKSRHSWWQRTVCSLLKFQ